MVRRFRTFQYLTALGLTISVVLLFLCFRKISWTELARAMGAISVPFLLLGWLVNLSVQLLRAFRISLVSSTTSIPFWTCLKALWVSLAVNNLLPGRLGEAARPLWLSRLAKKKFGLCAGFCAIDHLLQAIGFVPLLILVALNFNLLLSVRDNLWIGVAILGALLSLLLLFSYWSGRIDESSKGIWKLLYAIRISPASICFLLALSTFIWTVQILCWSVVERAFGLPFAPERSLLALVSVNVAVALPSAPAGIGPFQFAVMWAYGQFGISREQSLAIALTSQLLMILPTTLIGTLLGGRDLIRYTLKRTVE